MLPRAQHLVGESVVSLAVVGVGLVATAVAVGVLVQFALPKNADFAALTHNRSQLAGSLLLLGSHTNRSAGNIHRAAMQHRRAERQTRQVVPQWS